MTIAELRNELGFWIGQALAAADPEDVTNEVEIERLRQRLRCIHEHLTATRVYLRDDD